MSLNIETKTNRINKEIFKVPERRKDLLLFHSHEMVNCQKENTNSHALFFEESFSKLSVTQGEYYRESSNHQSH